MGFKIPNISFSHKVYLKLCVNLPHVGDDLLNELNNVITSLTNRRLLSKVIRRKVSDKAFLNKDCVNEFHNKQNAYRFWSQNRSPFLWEEYVVYRRC